MLDFYLKELGFLDIPDYLKKYLHTQSILRLKKIGYFCGMDYASKDIYNFKEYISRYDHSLTTSLLINKLTHDKKETLAGLYHDVATPCFSHVIDYMNGDYENQESTEEYTKNILEKDTNLKKFLKKDGIDLEEIINFKKYSVVDNNRPKMCADRIDGIILTGIGWTNNITKEDIKNILDDLVIVQNEDKEKEIGFKTEEIANKVLKINQSIDLICHSKEDTYMMELLANITKLSIKRSYINYQSLYKYQEDQILAFLKIINDSELKEYLDKFENIKKEEIPDIELPKIKVRSLNPLVNGKRIKGGL